MRAKSTFLAWNVLPSPTWAPGSPNDDGPGLPVAAHGGNISPERRIIRWMSNKAGRDVRRPCFDVSGFPNPGRCPMAFTCVTSDNGVIYALANSGALLWYQDTKRDGTNGPNAESGWAANSGSTIGTGWNEFKCILAGGAGIIYAIKVTGELLWYCDRKGDGTSDWDPNSGAQIGFGWDQFEHVFYGGQGIIYAVKPTGELLWYQDLKRDGTNGAGGQTGWAAGSGNQIGVGWDAFDQVLSGDDGVIYVIKPTGELLWYQDVARNGTNGAGGEAGWDPKSGSQIGFGWRFGLVFGGGSGIIYAIRLGGELLWYRDLKRDGTNGADGSTGWDANSGNQIGLGWTPSGLIEGYCSPLSVAPGDTINFFVSAFDSTFTVTYLRLKVPRQLPATTPTGEDIPVGISMGTSFDQTGRRQLIPAVSPWEGCDWDSDFSLTIPTDWSTGLYAAQCVDTSGNQLHIVFVVKPADGQRNALVALVNTNTWNAYNGWGGGSHYGPVIEAILGLLRPNPSTSPISDGQVNHLTLAELWVLGWLEDSGYGVDLYSDHDFHQGIENFAGYKGLILNTHPEYWTTQMLDHLESYLALGGSVVYLGGNGIFETCTYDPADENSMIFYGGDPNQGRPRNFFRNLTPPRPERAVLGVAFLFNNYLTISPPSPYKVVAANHRFFNGTGLANDALIGAVGLNGSASGWEMDTSEAGTAADGTIVTAWEGDDRGIAPADIQVLAVGTNRPGDGNLVAHMTSYETGQGGVVFAAGSLCFSGSLVVDANLQTIVRNVLNECLSKSVAPSTGAL
jgi:hypothetical protein